MAAPQATVSSLAGNLADNLRYVRERRTLTQSQLAKLSGVPRSTIANIETGAANPTLSVLARVAGALQLSLEELLTAPPARCQLFPKGSLPVQARGRGGKATVQKLLPHAIPGMEIDRMSFAPGERMREFPTAPARTSTCTVRRGRSPCGWRVRSSTSSPATWRRSPGIRHTPTSMPGHARRWASAW